MARPGDIVEFKAGHLGIEAPNNLGVLLARRKRKGVPWVEVVTVDGVHEMKAEHLTRRAFKDRYEGRLDATAEVQARLRHLIAQHAQGSLVEEAEDDLGALEEALWHKCNDGQVRDEEAIAALHYGEPSPQQLRDVRAALDRCRRPGIGRFETAHKGDAWRAWTAEEVAQMRAARDALIELRASMIQVEETEEGRVFSRQPFRESEAWAWVVPAMAQFIEHDGVPEQEIVGYGGLGAVKAFGLDLHRDLGFLAQDWIQSGHTTRSSDYVHFLLETGLWTPDDAVASLTRRHVNQEPFFEHVQDEAAEDAARALADPAPTPDREDLRHLTCHTIDPPDAKDFDDAVGLEKLATGTRLWVHIADVSHYVVPGTLLDRHAKNRATSVYLPGRVLPMLPAHISDHLCSLRDDGDRFALSVAMDVDPTGKVTGASFHKALIRVDENLSYDNALQRRAEAPFADLFQLATTMRAHRRGLAIETSEIRIAVQDAFAPEQKVGNEATQMIETFMVAANEAVARHLREQEIPFLHRAHPLPDRSKAERYQHQLQTMGLNVPFDLPQSATGNSGGQSLLDQLKAGGGKLVLGGLGMPEPTVPDEDPPPAPEGPTGFASLPKQEQEAWLAPFRTALDALHALPGERAEVATLKLLGCMGQAYYTPQHEGHFGLALEDYCHFTSPIRRYPDLVVHRNLKWSMQGDGPMPHQQEDLQRMCDHCSDQERAAAALERTVKNACLVLASLHETQDHARITGITPASVFLRFPSGIEARAAARDLPGAPFHVDEWESMLYHLDGPGSVLDEETGEMRRVQARLGDRVRAQLSGRDVAAGKTNAFVTW